MIDRGTGLTSAMVPLRDGRAGVKGCDLATIIRFEMLQIRRLRR